jgi:PiT family inorganic phosphate transporter
VDATITVFLLGGLFLGWSLGANDAANVFGTAVGTRMVRFGIAAAVCSVFVILGAVFSGAGAAQTLGKLGAVNAIPGAGTAAFSAALTVYWMTKLGLPVSTSQAIVGAIVGWNLFTGSPTDTESLIKILSTWIACPILAGLIGALLYKLTVVFVRWAKFHLFRLDAYTRLALILAGAFGSYALGANNIANVMGVFLPSNPFTAFGIDGTISFTATEQLFLLGGVAIAVGVYTYSKRVMFTVGANLVPLTPIGAWVVVVAHSIVLFLFASQNLEHLLARSGLPTVPLVPVSSSQAVVGAVIGIGLLKSVKGIQWPVLGKIAGGWVTTPVISGLLCFVALFFLQNVFNQTVFRDSPYLISSSAVKQLEQRGIETQALSDLAGIRFSGLSEFKRILEQTEALDPSDFEAIIDTARVDPITIDVAKLNQLKRTSLSPEQQRAVLRLVGQTFLHRWMLVEALASESDAWRGKPDTTVNKLHNRKLEDERRELYWIFSQN